MWGAPPGQANGVYRSDDEGASWLRINDDAHEFGGLANGQFILGDANVYGRVYMSSAGRGILVGTPEPSAGRFGVRSIGRQPYPADVATRRLSR
jgi:xyloglucan-specific exo-beta-1,4-glucanase